MSPYPGLLPFGVEDAEVFHGRERMAEELRAAAAGPGLLILVGPSGSGKTSLLHAGLLATEQRQWVVTTPRTPLRPAPELLVVDRLEELFALDRPEREAFLHTLTRLSDETRIVLALDAACYGQAAEHPALAKALRDNQLLVEPMTTDERRAAIEGPATGLELEEGLADEILRDTTTLPQLAHALWATWRQRTGTRLTIEAYRAEGTIEATAERVYAELAPHEQEAARRMLPRLVRLGDTTPDITVSLPRDELLSGLPDVRAGERVLDLLTEARLLTQQHDVRISHDVVLQAWPRLGEWLAAERDWRPARHRFSEDAQRWHQAGRAKSLLYRGEQLAAATRSAAAAPSRASDLDAGTAEFLAQSWRGEQRRLRRRRTVLALLAVLAVVAPAGLVGAAKFAQQAEQARTRDLARSLAAEAEFLRDRKPGLAKQLSVLSYRLDREAGRRAMLNSQNTPGVIADEKVVTDVVPDADGDLLAVVAVNEIMLRGRERQGRLTDLIPGAVAVSRDATRLVAADFDGNEAKSGVLRFYDVTDPSRPRQTAELPMPAVIRSLVLSDDGDTLYAGTAGGDVLIWDLTRPDTPKALPKPEGHGSAVDSLAVAPRRGLLASASVDGQVKLWDIVDPTRPAPVTTLEGEKFTTSRSPREPLHRVAFDPTGVLLATSAAGGGTNVWRLDDPRAPQQVPKDEKGLYSSRHCDDPVLSLAFSPHGDQLAVACGSKWRVLTHRAVPAPGVLSVSTSSDHNGLQPGPVVFDPTGRRLLQVDAVGVYVWDVGNPHQPGAKGFVPEEPGTGGQLSYRRTGDRQLLAVKGVGTNALWDVTDPAAPKKLHTAPAPNLFSSAAIAISQNGELFAAAELYDDGKMVGVSLRSTENPGGQPLAMIEDLDNGIAEIAFSPTRPLMVISDVHGFAKSNQTPASLRFYDIADPARPRQIAKLPIEVWDAEFSPDGTVLTVMAHGEVASLPYNPDAGKQLRGIDLTDPAHPVELWRKPLPSGLQAEFAHSPDGSLFAALDSTQTLRLWRIQNRKPAGDPVKAVVGNGKASGKLAFSPDGKRIALTGGERRGSDFVTRPEIWDVSDPGAPVQQFYLPGGDSASFYDLEFGPDGSTLAIVHAFAGVGLWDTDGERIVAGLCNAPGDPITEQQWERFLPGKDYRPPCG